MAMFNSQELLTNLACTHSNFEQFLSFSQLLSMDLLVLFLIVLKLQILKCISPLNHSNTRIKQKCKLVVLHEYPVFSLGNRLSVSHELHSCLPAHDCICVSLLLRDL